MAENNTEQKFFLDWGGLQTLWTKITSTFANKEYLEKSVNDINTTIAELEEDLDVNTQALNLRIDGVEDTMETFMPREFTDYTTAVNGVSTLTPGTVINITSDSQHLDSEGNPIPNEDGSTPTYKKGLYLVINPGEGKIEKISTASGTGASANIEEVTELVNELNETVVKSAIVTDENGVQKSEIEFDKVNNTLIFKIDDKFEVDSQSVNALTHKAVAAMFGELNDRITQIPKFKIKVVDSLPNPETDEISYTTIYLVRNVENNDETKNLYMEFIRVQDSTNGDFWEKLGEQTLSLDGFVTTEWVEGAIATAMQGVVKESQLNQIIDDAKGEILSEIGNTYATKEEVEKFIDQDELTTKLESYYTKEQSDNKYLTPELAEGLYATKDDIKDFMDEDEIITSILYGNIGDSIRISDELIESLGKIEENQ